MVDDLYGTSDYGTTQPAAGGSTGKPPLRDSAAQDVDGGCGQLRARVLSAESKARAEQAVRRTATPFDRNSNA